MKAEKVSVELILASAAIAVFLIFVVYAVVMI